MMASDPGVVKTCSPPPMLQFGWMPKPRATTHRRKGPTRVTKTRIADAIFLVRFPTQYQLAATFLRFQEHFESRYFRGRVFSLEAFMDWYAAEFGGFTYYQDWAGFNIPSTALAPFYAGDFDPLLEKEQRLLALFARERQPYYIIGITRAASSSDLQHELGHALFFTVPAYADAVRAAMRGHNTKPIERRLLKMGYHPSVLQDEVHAYLLTDAKMAARSRQLSRLRRELRGIFNRHAAELTKSWGAPWGSKK